VSSAAGRRFVQIVLCAYSGPFLDDPAFATWSVADNVTSRFPPTFLTVGNTDPLRPHSERLAEKLRAQGAEVETLFFAEDHEPPLGHEYQFDLDTDAGQLFLERLVAFLRQRLGPPTHA
jgi:acetyl esterase